MFVFYGLFGPAPARATALPGSTEVVYHTLPVGSPEDVASGRGAMPMHWFWATVRYGASGVYGLLRAHPNGELSAELGGLERRHNKVERERAYRGLAYLRARAQRGSSPLLAEEFLQLCQETAVLLWLGGTRVFKPLTIYTARGWGPSRFYELLADYRAQGYPWARSGKALCSHLELYAEREVLRRRRAGVPDIPDR